MRNVVAHAGESDRQVVSNFITTAFATTPRRPSSNGEIKRRTEVVGIFPNGAAIVGLIGAILLEQNHEWSVQRCRYMALESAAPLSDDPIVSLPIMAN